MSSEELAKAAGVNSAKLRKDLSHLGSYGTRGVGYDVDYLIYQVSRELGLTQDWPVIIIGAGNLGRALANYGGFATRGFRVAAMIDADPLVIGTSIATLIAMYAGFTMAFLVGAVVYAVAGALGHVVARRYAALARAAAA